MSFRKSPNNRTTRNNNHIGPTKIKLMDGVRHVSVIQVPWYMYERTVACFT